MNKYPNPAGGPADPSEDEQLFPASAGAPPEERMSGGRFQPQYPRDLAATGLNQLLVEDLMLKDLLNNGLRSGRDLATNLHLPFSCIKDLLSDLKTRMVIGQKVAIGVGDFVYYLSDQGRDRAIAAREVSAYAGAAPITFEEYLRSVEAQSIRLESPDEQSLKHAFDDLVVNPEILAVIGPALSSGRGMFLFGAPGNGKTALAERVCKCFGDSIYLPRTLIVEGTLVQLFDPQYHTEVETHEAGLTPSFDQRWVKIERPLVVVGGELTLDQLEIKFNQVLKICEAPLQLKANCGIFLIDDFGRQRVHQDTLLNRWIIPLEKRIDYLSLPNGRRIMVPFDELIVFSTNLDPKELVDDAFLRRIPYKIHVKDPTEDEFRSVMRFVAPKHGIDYDDEVFDYLVGRHYRGVRPFRICQARDLMEQIVNSCSYQRRPPKMTETLIDEACRNYFSAMSSEPDTGEDPSP